MWSPGFQASPPRRGAEVGGKPLRIPVPTQLGIENLVALARTREQPPSRPPSGRRRVAQAHEVLRYLSKAPAAPLLAEGSAALAVSEERYLHLPLGRLLPGERLPDRIQDPYPHETAAGSHRSEQDRPHDRTLHAEQCDDQDQHAEGG